MASYICNNKFFIFITKNNKNTNKNDRRQANRSRLCYNDETSKCHISCMYEPGFYQREDNPFYRKLEYVSRLTKKKTFWDLRDGPKSRLRSRTSSVTMLEGFHLDNSI